MPYNPEYSQGAGAAEQIIRVVALHYSCPDILNGLLQGLNHALTDNPPEERDEEAEAECLMEIVAAFRTLKETTED